LGAALPFEFESALPADVVSIQLRTDSLGGVPWSTNAAVRAAIVFPAAGQAAAGSSFSWGDERYGDYTRERLLRMDQKFTTRIERALARGAESLPAMSGLVEPRAGFDRKH
jgi:hypothetical protein